MDLKYIQASSCEGGSGDYFAGVKIHVATGGRELSQEEQSLISQFTDKIYYLLLTGHAKVDAKDIEAGKQETKALLACFPKEIQCSGRIWNQ